MTARVIDLEQVASILSICVSYVLYFECSPDITKYNGGENELLTVKYMNSAQWGIFACTSGNGSNGGGKRHPEGPSKP